MKTIKEPLPDIYYYFFWIVEPVLTLAGAGYAIFKPAQYGLDLLPEGYESVTSIIGETSRGQMLIGGLGSCFTLLAMISLSLLPLIKKHLAHLPEIQEKIFRGLLIPLAIADLLHIGLTLLPLPMSLLKTPSQWTQLINGNVWITLSLFIVRSSWLLGIGRSVPIPHMSAAATKEGEKDAIVGKTLPVIVPSSPSPAKSRARAKKTA